MGEDCNFLKEQILISSSVDNYIEHCQKNRYGLKRGLYYILKNSISLLDGVAGFIYTYDETLTKRFFYYGEKNLPDRYNLREYINIKDTESFEYNGKIVVITPLDIADEIIGVTGFIFEKNETIDVEKIEVKVDLFSEELDNYLYHVKHERVKQRLIAQLNEAIRKQVLNEGIFDAVNILHREIKFKRIALVYYDSTDVNITYKIFGNSKTLFDNSSLENREQNLDNLIQKYQGDLFSEDDNKIMETLNFNGGLQFSLVSGKIDNEKIGKVAVEFETKDFNTYSRDLIHVFSQIVNYRLVDFNREQRVLRRSFSKKTTSLLLKDPDYAEKYLKPKVKNSVILFSDINSFTKISEQIFKDPVLLGKFIDYWSKHSVDIVYKYGGVFDKMVGDCIIAIFGPPFFDATPEECLLNAIKATHEILKFTIEVADRPEFSVIKSSSLIKGLGVATGINYAPLNVGIFGRHSDYTGFSSGMNNTARLQSLAGYRETLIMSNLKEMLNSCKKDDPILNNIIYGERKESMVKNVAEPLKYYPIIFKDIDKMD